MYRILALSMLALAGLSVQADRDPVHNVLRPFVTDGCSSFFDGIPYVDDIKWQHCCIEHDVAYWQGGTSGQRLAADRKLRQCVADTGEPTLARIIYIGVRAGGAEGLPTSWHWGYGWTWHRGYAPLSESEQAQVEELSRDIPADFSELPIVSAPALRQRQSLTGDHCLDVAHSILWRDLGEDVQIRELRESLEEKAEGYSKYLRVFTTQCTDPYEFEFLLLRKDACTASMSELLARGRLRLKSVKAAMDCR